MPVSLKKSVVESNIPVAASHHFNDPMTVRKSREMQDVRDWLELQEEAEMEFLTHELAMKCDRQYSHEEWSANW